jgi:hypothetical protein
MYFVPFSFRNDAELKRRVMYQKRNKLNPFFNIRMYLCGNEQTPSNCTTRVSVNELFMKFR